MKSARTLPGHEVVHRHLGVHTGEARMADRIRRVARDGLHEALDDPAQALRVATRLAGMPDPAGRAQLVIASGC